MIDSFEALLAPRTPAEFFADFHDQRWLHVPGAAERGASLLSWDTLNRLLDMNVWSSRTLELTLDRRKLPPSAYCVPAVDRSHQNVMRPDPARVMELARRGASMVLNEVETLHPPLRRIVTILEAALGAKASANVYCSWQAHQAFDSHYDRHDVFALHVLGQKTWRVYRGRVDNPIEHPLFHNVPQAEYDRMKGPVGEEIVMRPGDLLYLPRGQFHDALADSAASIHVTFSASEPNGLDWLTQLWNQAVEDPAFRAYLPPGDGAAGEERMRRHLEQLADRLRALALSPDSVRRLCATRGRFGTLADGFAFSDPEHRD